VVATGKRSNRYKARFRSPHMALAGGVSHCAGETEQATPSAQTAVCPPLPAALVRRGDRRLHDGERMPLRNSEGAQCAGACPTARSWQSRTAREMVESPCAGDSPAAVVATGKRLRRYKARFRFPHTGFLARGVLIMTPGETEQAI